MSTPLATREKAGSTIGRFVLRRVLGQGAQATVWLAFDPRLQREVALKAMRPAETPDDAAMQLWLHEARSVSQLTHPNIVPVFEADTHGQQPYLVFEYVPGATLAEHLRARGALPAREAVGLMLQVLSALAAAHGLGVVHRDLKPSNVLVDMAGKARVMDFGIAARMRDGESVRSQQVVGTPGYLSPEAADGSPPTPAMDIFAAGLVLGEMLAGRPVLSERDPYRAIHRASQEDLRMPETPGNEVDDALRAIAQRAMARMPAQRHASANEMHEALSAWLSPAAQKPAAAAQNGTLDFLMRRMRHKTDFPALSDSIARIQRVANSDNESVGSLSGEILKDVALTNKLLRLVNTVQYSQAGGNVSTVSRAVMLVGFAGVRNMALSLVLLEHMQDKAHAGVLRDEFLRSLMAGTMAGQLCRSTCDGEEAFIGAVFQNLGRLLTEFYFPEEARQVRSLVAGVRNASAEEVASVSVLGLSYEDLGVAVAKAWGLPDALQRCMRKPAGAPPGRGVDQASERMRWLTLAANDVADVLVMHDADQAPARLQNLAKRYAASLGLKVADIESAVDEARRKLVQMAGAMGLQVQKGSPAERLLRPHTPAPAPSHDTLSPHALHATMPLEREPTNTGAASPVDGAGAIGPGAPNPHAASDILAAGIQDITNSMVENFKLNEVLRMILETMFRALGFRHIVFCLRDPKTNALTGRFGLGAGAEQVASAFKVSLKPSTDLFTLVCLKGADTLISDATVPNIASRLPAWYRESVDAPAFLLLPLLMKGAPFALIYADKSQPGEIALSEKDLSMLRTLRNQAVMAFKQAG